MVTLRSIVEKKPVLLRENAHLTKEGAVIFADAGDGPLKHGWELGRLRLFFHAADADFSAVRFLNADTTDSFEWTVSLTRGSITKEAVFPLQLAGQMTLPDIVLLYVSPFAHIKVYPSDEPWKLDMSVKKTDGGYGAGLSVLAELEVFRLVEIE